MFKACVCALFVPFLLASAPISGNCASYPEKPIHLICHTKAGSGMDALMRLQMLPASLPATSKPALMSPLLWKTSPAGAHLRL